MGASSSGCYFTCGDQRLGDVSSVIDTIVTTVYLFLIAAVQIATDSGTRKPQGFATARFGGARAGAVSRLRLGSAAGGRGGR